MRELLLTVLMMLSCISAFSQTKEDIDALQAYIAENMPKTVRSNTEDTPGSYGLPTPYSVPCIQKGFQSMYYWDTYFTNVGLIILGDATQAKNNTDDILSLIDRLGFMPNSSSKSMANRSQAPYASMMVRDVFEVTRDKAWLEKACSILEKEYNFWMERRISPNGLNRYGNQATSKELLRFYDVVVSRMRVKDAPALTDSEKVNIGSHFLAEAESWDFNPRYDSRCRDFNPIDLNSNLYLYEKNFAYFYKVLGKGRKEVRKWLSLADKRKDLMNRYCLNPNDGLFYDYDYINGSLSKIYSAAEFNLLWSGLATKSQARTIVQALPRLEEKYGIVPCEKGERQRIYQWDYPNCWAPLQLLAIKGLDKYGYKQEALRIARKYTTGIINNYKHTGNLWEKYNAVTGNLDVNDEYKMPGAFMGWTAGVFMFASNYSLVSNSPDTYQK